MKRNTIIKDLHSLKLAQLEREAETAERELSMKLKAYEIWDNLFDFSFKDKGGAGGLKGFLVDNVSPITQSISDFLINKIIKPKSVWVRKASLVLSSLLIEKYSGTIQFLINTLFKEEPVETKSDL
jgi:hypothetical protein